MQILYRRERDSMKIGFIGLGNMATAMIGGMLKQGLVQAGDVIGADKATVACDKIKSELNITIGIDNADVAKHADVLFLAVKPIYMEEVISEIRDVVAENTLIVSIAAGKTLTFLKEKRRKHKR